MCAANHRAVLDHRKAKAELLTNEARLRQNNQISGSRYQDAVRLLRLADAEIGTLVNDVRADIVAHEQKGEALRQEVIAQTKKQWQEAKEREKEGGRSGETSKTEEDAIEDALAASLRTPAGETHTKTKGALGNRLRDCQLLAHKIKFFMGDVYHILDPGSPEEAKAYQAADDIRSVILAGKCRAIDVEAFVN
jgi:E3 ubiquitin-protein ligase SHPRH